MAVKASLYELWLAQQPCACGRKATSLHRTGKPLDLPVPACSACLRDESVNWHATAASYMLAYLSGGRPVLVRKDDGQGNKGQDGHKREKPRAVVRTIRTKPNADALHEAIASTPLHVLLSIWVSRRVQKGPPANWLPPQRWAKLLQDANLYVKKLMEEVGDGVRSAEEAV